MSDFKYSLKTKEYSKRKYHIFPKKQTHQQIQPSQHTLVSTPTPIISRQLCQSKSSSMSHQRRQEQALIDGLTFLKAILIENENKMYEITQKVNILYKTTLQTYEQHEKNLQKLVRQRCEEFTKMMRTFIKCLEKKDNNLESIDKRVTTFQNTLRHTYETLRTTKLKQDCIEVMIKNASEQKKLFQTYTAEKAPKTKEPDSFWKDQTIQESIEEGNDSLFMLDQVKSNSSQNFFSNHIEQVSPFQTNHYLMMESTIPKTTSEYSFQALQKSEKYEKLRKEVEKLIKNGRPIEGWFDNQGYLRRRNGTYVFGEKGDVLSCSKNDFSRLIEENLIIQMKK